MPSSQSSNLSSARYGYDFVVATTQASINGTMMNFLSSLKEPIVNICFVASTDGKLTPVPIAYDTLKAKANGTDPFAIPDGTSTDDPRIQALFRARFMLGFRARIGLPRVPDPSKLPDLVTLGSETSAVLFTMYCSQFEVVQLLPPGGYSSGTWMNMSQPAAAPWLFTSKVDMRMSTVESNAYNKLPKDVQAKIQNLSGSAFSIQQLLFDLSSAGLMMIPTMSNVTPGTQLYTALQQYFVGAYFAEMQKESQPLLGCSIVKHTADPATMTLTALNFEVNPLMNPGGTPYPAPTKDQQKLATLNYLCAADGNVLKPAVQFNWNWVDPSELKDHDGTIAINRNTFAHYFRNKLDQFVPANCIQTWVSVNYDAGKAGTTFQWNLTKNQQPTVTIPLTGKTVLQYDYHSSARDGAGLGEDMGILELQDTYSCTVDFEGNTITVTQHQVVYMYARSLQTAGSGNLVDKKIVDTYTIGIDAQGKLVADLKSVPTDTSYRPQVDGFLDFFTDFNKISDKVSDTVQFASTQLQDMPISTVQDYVFPGGKTFVFKHVGFSAFQDLVSYISYVDPNTPTSVPKPSAAH